MTVQGTDIHLRIATKADLPQWLDMVRAYYNEDGLTFDESLQPAALSALVEGEPLASAWLIVSKTETLGYIVITYSFSIESGGKDGFIDEFFIKPEFRNQGIGSTVLNLACKNAKSLELSRLYLEVEHKNRAIALYKRVGFIDHKRYLLSRKL